MAPGLEKNRCSLSFWKANSGFYIDRNSSQEQISIFPLSESGRSRPAVLPPGRAFRAAMLPGRMARFLRHLGTLPGGAAARSRCAFRHPGVLPSASRQKLLAGTNIHFPLSQSGRTARCRRHPGQSFLRSLARRSRMTRVLCSSMSSRSSSTVSLSEISTSFSSNLRRKSSARSMSRVRDLVL